MASLADRYTLATDTAYLRKVEVRIVAFSKVVLEENANTANHDERVALARKVLSEHSVDYARRFGLLTVSDPAVDPTAPTGGDLTDNALDGAIQAAWNAIAGVAT